MRYEPKRVTVILRIDEEVLTQIELVALKEKKTRQEIIRIILDKVFIEKGVENEPKRQKANCK